MKEKINLSWVTRGYYMLKKAQSGAIKTKGSKVTPMPRPRIKLMSVQLHLFWGTFIQDALPTELPRLRLGVKDTGRCPNVILVWWYPTASRKKAWGKISQSLSPYEIIFNISHFVFAYMKLKFLGVVRVHISYLYMEFLWKVKIHWVVGWEFLDNLSNV